jgi:hypothetical protein
MFDRRMQAEIFPYCAAQQMGVMAYGSLAYGLLTGTFHADMQFDENDWRSRAGQMGVLNLFRTLFGPDDFPRNLRAVEELKALTAEYHKTLPQFALRWTMSHPVIRVALVGCRQPAEVEENLGALNWAISENEGAWAPQARLRDMDAMGVDQTLLYPTWFAEGFHLVHDPDVAYALARAYNNWIADFCAAAPDRLFATAMVPLQNMDFALEELQRVATIPCFRGAFLRPMFLEGRYFTHPYYD